MKIKKEKKAKESTPIQKENINELVSKFDKDGKEKEKSQKKRETEENKTNVNKAKTFLQRITLSILDLIPLKKPADTGRTGFEMENGSYMNIYKINSYDYNSATDAELLTHIYSWDKFYRTFSNDCKIVAINMPIVVASNIRYIIHKYQRIQNPLYREALSTFLEEFRQELRDREDKQFYIFLYAKDYDEMLKINARFEGSMVSEGYAAVIPYKQKLQVFQKYSNPYNNILRPRTS